MLLHSTTKAHIESFVKNPSHGLIISGVEGSGKFYLAQKLAAKILGIGGIDDLLVYPYLEIVQAEDGVIKIDQIRHLGNFLQLKTIGDRRLRRVVVIKDAHQMNVQSQNAILKILEEPPSDTIIIMTVCGETSLKPTLYSRAQNIKALPVSEAEATAYFSEKYQESEIKGAYLYSGGAVGLMTELLTNPDSDYIVWRDRAKHLLSSTQATRLAQINELIKDRNEVKKLIFALKKLSLVGLHQSSAGNRESSEIKAWSNRLHNLLLVERRFRSR
jgi:hypothetical protein